MNHKNVLPFTSTNKYLHHNSNNQNEHKRFDVFFQYTIGFPRNQTYSIISILGTYLHT